MALETSERIWLEVSWESLSKEALNKEMSRYMMEWDTDKAQALLEFIKAKENPEGANKFNETFRESYDNFQKSMDDKNKELQKLMDDKNKETDEDKKKALQEEISKKEKEIRDEWQRFFKGDMQNYVDTVWTTVKFTEEAKDAEIDRLKNQLSWIVSNGPTLKEYFSIKRRRLVTLNDGIRKLEQDKENYPKNVLIYLMWLTSANIVWIRGARNRLNRKRVKASWNRKADDIKKHLENFEESIKVRPWESEWTMWLKKQLQEHLQKAKEAYIDHQKSSVGL